MHLLGLPEELLLNILGACLEGEAFLNTQEYARLSLVNKHLRRSVYPLLHRVLNIRFGTYKSDDNMKTDDFARGRLVQGSGLGAYVRELSLECAHGQVEYAEDACLDCIRVVPKVETLSIGYSLGRHGTAQRIAGLLRTGVYTRLTSLKITESICPCEMVPFFFIPGLKSLDLGYYSSYNEDRCAEAHDVLLEPQKLPLRTSSVEDFRISGWDKSATMTTLLNLPRALVKFSGIWRPSDTRYSPCTVPEILSMHKDTLERIELNAFLDTEDEYEPQHSDGSVASFADFTALRDLICDVDILLTGSANEAWAKFDEQLPTQLEQLCVHNIPRRISSFAHENRLRDPDMAQLDMNLVWLRSLARANLQGRLALRNVVLQEHSHLPGPLCGPYSRPEFLHTQWNDKEKTAWADRDPFPFKDAGIELTAHLVFVIKEWTRTESSRRARAES